MLIPVYIGPPREGWGYIGGFPPPDPNPDDYDGRVRVLNVPASIRISVHDATQDSAPILRQTYSKADGTWQLHALPTETRLLVIFWNDGEYTELVGGELRPVNSFVQDHIHATPYDED